MFLVPSGQPPPDTERKVTTLMIKLTRLAGEAFLLNAELIRYVESRPDTFITLTTGERLVVQESMDEVMLRTIEYQRNKHLFPRGECTAAPAISSTSRI
jgi:flagellar protein FlbD